ncbi:hypothetical protein D3C72_1667270 [compost metagenome]
MRSRPKLKHRCKLPPRPATKSLTLNSNRCLISCTVKVSSPPTASVLPRPWHPWHQLLVTKSRMMSSRHCSISCMARATLPLMRCRLQTWCKRHLLLQAITSLSMNLKRCSMSCMARANSPRTAWPLPPLQPLQSPPSPHLLRRLWWPSLRLLRPRLQHLRVRLLRLQKNTRPAKRKPPCASIPHAWTRS